MLLIITIIQIFSTFDFPGVSRCAYSVFFSSWYGCTENAVRFENTLLLRTLKLKGEIPEKDIDFNIWSQQPNKYTLPSEALPPNSLTLQWHQQQHPPYPSILYMSTNSPCRWSAATVGPSHSVPFPVTEPGLYTNTGHTEGTASRPWGDKNNDCPFKRNGSYSSLWKNKWYAKRQLWCFQMAKEKKKVTLLVSLPQSNCHGKPELGQLNTLWHSPLIVSNSVLKMYHNVVQKWQYCENGVLEHL